VLGGGEGGRGASQWLVGSGKSKSKGGIDRGAQLAKRLAVKMKGVRPSDQSGKGHKDYFITVRGVAKVFAGKKKAWEQRGGE